MWINSSHLLHRRDHLHDCFASCTTFQGVWKMFHILQSPSPQQTRQMYPVCYTNTNTPVQKLNLVIKACVCHTTEAEGLICLPRHQELVWFVVDHSFAGSTDMPVPPTAPTPAPEPQAHLTSSTTWSMLPGEGIPAHEATQSLSEKATKFVKQRSCKEKRSFLQLSAGFALRMTTQRETTMATIPHQSYTTALDNQRLLTSLSFLWSSDCPSVCLPSS